MRIGVKGAVLALAVCAAVSAVRAEENAPGFAIAQGPARQREGVVNVIVDFARPLILPRPANTVIVGNAAIAQATLSDDKTVILTGKTPGSTNLIVMDAEGAEIANVVLEVLAAGGRLITVHQSNGRATYSCSRSCDPIASGEENLRPPAAPPQASEGDSSTGGGEP
ncbi:pilus assembly protein N-terminal domain-containing protein [Sinorhizobium numidicum]|uniref:Pilus assembly protein N-terminal domain-containing protein n=1 Tax=Sinorhizobium numidicum TaxID=680248 RepID=A0ABY8CQX9_9HYPH|nr:pilus assembly protein N-terminal domain-containing protein [Sinorhizobium numidicum]WEX75054.1 pilus assembly protein N-terminal domain-containing protein [Sinorhizobium numidicum]WEX81048.1 pilus assembly protein N-terminal domain-containing protein [Sinorhizobium numidicum]